MASKSYSLNKITISYVKEGTIEHRSITTIDSAKTAAENIFRYIANAAQEVFCVMHLNCKHQIIGYHEAFKGGFESCIVDPKVIFQAALLSGASKLILVHNHPSDDRNPSTDDIQMTKKVQQAASYLDMKIIDHIIITSTGSYSFKENGVLE